MICDFGHRENLLKAFVSNWEAEIVMRTWGVTSSVYFCLFYVFMETFVYRTGHFYSTFGGPVCWIISTRELGVRRAPKISHEGIVAISLFVFYKFRVWIIFSAGSFAKRVILQNINVTIKNESKRLNDIRDNVVLAEIMLCLFICVELYFG